MRTAGLCPVGARMYSATLAATDARGSAVKGCFNLESYSGVSSPFCPRFGNTAAEIASSVDAMGETTPQGRQRRSTDKMVDVS